jgi:NAD(P)H-flavin reductase
MSQIIAKKRLSEQVWQYRLQAPRIARKRKAGQFVIVRPAEGQERIPLTIADADAGGGWIEIIFQVVGHGTMHLAELNEGDCVADLVGPLGQPTHIEKFGRCLCIGGGVGVAPLFPIVCALHEAGNDVTVVIGARTQDLLILEQAMAEHSRRVLVATDDGSKGVHGFVSSVVVDLLQKGEKFDFAVVIGPTVMMRVVSDITVKAGVKTFASLNPIMIDGTGMCGGCRVTVHGQTKFACVDGPEFDASGVDWGELMNRLGAYRNLEQRAAELHACRLEAPA